MNQRWMPLSANRLGTPETTESQALAGFPLAQLTDTGDLSRPCLLEGRIVVVPELRRLDFKKAGAGAELTAVLDLGDYSIPEYAEHAAAKLTAAGADEHRVIWRQDGAARHRFQIENVDDTSSWLFASGINEATSAAPQLGLEKTDRAALATLTGDVPVISMRGHTGLTTERSGERLQWDLTTAQAVRCAAVINPEMSPSGRVRVVGAASASAFTAEETLGDFDPRLMVGFFDAKTYRYWTVYLDDVHRTDLGMVGAGYIYIGDYWEPDRNWDATSYNLTTGQQWSGQQMLDGAPYLSGARTGDVLSFSYGNVGATDGVQFRHMLQGLGKRDPVIISSVPDDEPTRESRLCRIESVSVGRRHGGTPSGRYAVSVTAKVVRS